MTRRRSRESCTIISATDKTAKVSLAAEGVELASPAEATVNVPKNGEAVVTWNVRAPKIAQAKFLAKALTDEESDALELEMPVEPWGLQQSVAQSGALRGDKDEITRVLVLPQEINSDASSACASTWLLRLPAR